VAVAEEDEGLRNALIDELSRGGFQVVELEDGLELRDYLEFAQSSVSRLSWPAVVVSDVELSGCGGIEVCEWVQVVQMEMPFILLSSTTELNIREAAQRAGAAYLFKKPISVEEVREAVAVLAGLRTINASRLRSAL
jgi:DNA-binding response OmpR family regulator